ncbi:MAG: hypothetical protein NT007_15645 [Candidatus Kapabacteria bacterium]|nr:hypothetical protein [Candidatus Kapabacteria bacterium]
MVKVKDLDEIVNGDLLAEPLINSFGALLLPAGTPITERQIRMMKMWNIKSVSVVMDVENYDSWLSDDVLTYAYRVFSERCPWTPESEIEADLFRMGVVHEARKVIDEMHKRR